MATTALAHNIFFHDTKQYCSFCLSNMWLFQLTFQNRDFLRTLPCMEKSWLQKWVFAHDIVRGWLNHTLLEGWKILSVNISASCRSTCVKDFAQFWCLVACFVTQANFCFAEKRLRWKKNIFPYFQWITKLLNAVMNCLLDRKQV